ncbi:dihydrolipoyl dehydrogenase [Paenibacillus sp. N1-5-1-14]|uniref:dihydrolipoyl dehydrogenase n=1 Tax=Paenibacillus radicibacter TaxID=2972488 RepID=UPI002158F603|nr:dihydrolipoyl dehydrogenase [Paenibacillus radicibacter]MCR8642388.1 dihydrolipoyl dehydrogenase [Paenibacillus radicibacter]
MSGNKPYDIVVLGGGIGGYTAAIRAAQQGKKVAIVEKDKLGGTCLHAGCIPSKAFLRSAEIYATIKDSERYGIMLERAELHFDKVQDRKNSIVNQLHQGVQMLMRKNKIDVYHGNGRIMGASIFSPRAGDVSVELPDGEIEVLVPQQLIIATGSTPRTLPGLEADGEFVLTSDEAMGLNELPTSMLIVGGGVIGVEWASLLNDFGVEVTIVEYENRLVAAEDEDISRELQRLLVKRGVKVVTGAKVLPESLLKDNGAISLQAEQGAEKVILQAEKVLVSVGRKPNVEGFGLDNTGVKVERGAIVVNEFMQTAEPHIYAVGDVIGGLQLAHVAGHEGIAAVDHICGKEVHPIQPHRVAKCTYTRPEIASIGWNESQAREQGRSVKIGKFPFMGAGKAHVYGELDGFVKVIADKDTNDILGVHMIGPHATELIGEAALADWLNATPWEVGAMIHPHPTLSEALGEAMMAVDGQAIGI